MPPDELQQPVEVFGELPGQAGLADTGRADDRDETSAPLSARRVEQVLEQAELVITSDEGRLQGVRATLATTFGDDPEGAPCRDRGGLAFEGLVADGFERDGTARRALGRLPHQDAAGRRHGLQARRRVDQIARHHPLARGAEVDHRLSGEDSGACCNARPERPHGVHQIECSPDRSLGVILARDGCTPDGHDRVADELLDRPAVASDDVARELEVARQQLPRVLRITTLRERREAHEVSEQDRDDAAFGDRRWCRRGRRSWLRGRGEGAAGRELGGTFAAELLAHFVQGTATRTRCRKRRRTLGAELATDAVLRTAIAADHRGQSSGVMLRSVLQGTRGNRARARARPAPIRRAGMPVRPTARARLTPRADRVLGAQRTGRPWRCRRRRSLRRAA